MIPGRLYMHVLVVCLVIAAIKPVADWYYEESFYWIGCGEALNRANGSAAPRNNREVQQWFECVAQGIKRWPKEK